MELELPHQPTPVKFHGLQADAQAGGDPLVGQAGDVARGDDGFLGRTATAAAGLGTFWGHGLTSTGLGTS
jgi:hypothetical protein